MRKERVDMEKQRDKDEYIPERARESTNEVVVELNLNELAPHVKVVRPTRPSLTYDRME